MHSSFPIPYTRRIALTCGSALLIALAGLLSGCGGTQDFGGFSRGLGGDISPGFNTSLAASARNTRQTAEFQRGTYPMIETSFQLASVPGDPFDYEKVNVQVSLRKPDGGTADVPAFFDGGTTWRMRYTPTAPGQYAVISVKLNRETAHETNLDKKDWTVRGDPQPGFVRIDRGDHRRFIFDDGARYFPLGQNQAWRTQGLPDIPALFDKMHAAGENWARIWMDHWDGKNLDWTTEGKQVKPGEIDLTVAKRWDAIVDAAEKDGIYLQLTLQHHGQYASKSGYRFSNNNNANWEENPYNVKNGGFLQSPEDFFTNPQARALTKRKLYYILSRWGYSPNIMAWELFNEVEGTDAGNGKLWDDIAMWHREMALFLRQTDGYHHLLTTSAYPGLTLENPVWETVDYIQWHAYPPDLIAAFSGTEPVAGKKLDKPMFVGEFGSQSLQDPQGIQLHNGLWASVMRGMAGAAEYWDWENVEKHDLYGQFQAMVNFLTASDFANHGGLITADLPVETSQRAALRFGPGGGWGNTTQSEFVVGTTGPPAGMDRFPAYLQGQSHRAMMPKPLTFQVSYTQPGAFAVAVAQVAKAGAHLVVHVDGKSAERNFPAADKDYQPTSGQNTVQVDVPVGAHTITVENTGTDWVVVRQFILTNYAPALAARARVGKNYAAAWVYERDNVDAPADREAKLEAATGRLSLPGLEKGRYRASWWDTRTGKSLDETDFSVTNNKDNTELATPPITRDVALYVSKAGTPPAGSAVGQKPRGERGRGTSEPASSTPSAPSASAPPSAPGGK